MGTGIVVGEHLTAEARSAIERADEVLHLAAEPIGNAFLLGLNPASRSLFGLYRPGVPREDIYARMADEMLAPVRAGRRVCVALYGHPGILARPAHLALSRAREEGLDARLLPAVSALDCLVADLELDPADTGLVTFDATDFVANGRRPDPTAALVLWQLSVLGMADWAAEPDMSRLGVLADYLGRWYPAAHEVTVYEASPYPVASAEITRVPLTRLAEVDVSPMASLYVPPAERSRPDPELTRRLGLPAPS